MPELRINGVTYHGGFSHIPESEWVHSGLLILDDDIVTMENNQVRSLPIVELCRTDAIATIEVTSEQAAKSRAGAVVLFGVLGGLAAKGSVDRATMIVHLKSGEKGYFTIDKQSVASLLGTLEPWMRERVIAVGAPQEEPMQTAASDPAEQLKKLADLHQSGLLTDEEFAAKRTAIVERL